MSRVHALLYRQCVLLLRPAAEKTDGAWRTLRRTRGTTTATRRATRQSPPSTPRTTARLAFCWVGGDEEDWKRRGR